MANLADKLISLAAICALGSGVACNGLFGPSKPKDVCDDRARSDWHMRVLWENVRQHVASAKGNCEAVEFVLGYWVDQYGERMRREAHITTVCGFHVDRKQGKLMMDATGYMVRCLDYLPMTATYVRFVDVSRGMPDPKRRRKQPVIILDQNPEKPEQSPEKPEQSPEKPEQGPEKRPGQEPKAPEPR